MYVLCLGFRDSFSCFDIFDGCRVKSANDSEEAVALAMKDFEGAITPFDVVTILNNLNSWRSALSLFKWLRAEQSSSLNIYTYNVMLKVLRRGRQWELSEWAARDMIHFGILPDNITYSTLISCANRCNRQVHKITLISYVFMKDFIAQ